MFRDHAEFIKSRIGFLVSAKQEQIVSGKVDTFEDYKRCIGYVQGVRDAIKIIDESCDKYYSNDDDEEIIVSGEI